MKRREFETLLQRCRALEGCLPHLPQELDMLASKLRNEKFATCIAGNFSRGKTRLLNQLLQTDVFPENALPSTTVLTETKYGPKEKMVFISAADETGFTLDRVNLELFCADGARSDAQGILSIEYPAKFLEPDLLLIDTPGIDDLLSRRADLAFAALQGSAGAVVAVSALSPLSLAEKTFIQTYLHDRAMPKIAATLTFLDQLEEDQQRRVLEYLAKIIAESWPEMEIWSPVSLPPDLARHVTANGIEEIRERLKTWAADPHLEALRMRRAALELEEILRSGLRRVEARLDVLQADRAAAGRKLREEREEINSASSSWLDLSRRFRLLGARRARELQDAVAGRADDIFQTAASSRQTFEAALRLNLEQVIAETSRDMRRKLREDVAGLLGEIRGRYHVEPAFSAQSLEIQPDFSGIDNIVDKNRQNVFSVLGNFDGIILDRIVFFLPLPPIARPVFRQLARLLLDFGKNLLRDDPEKRKEEIRAEIAAFLTSLSGEILSMTETLYGHIAEELRKEQGAWLLEQEKMLQAASEGDAAAEKTALLSRCAAELRSILAMPPFTEQHGDERDLS